MIENIANNNENETNDETKNEDVLRVYELIYKAYGRNYSTIVEIFVIGFDVSDIIEQLNRDCLGVELTYQIDNKLFHDVTERIEIIDCCLIAERLHTITDRAYVSLRNNMENDENDDDNDDDEN